MGGINITSTGNAVKVKPLYQTVSEGPELLNRVMATQPSDSFVNCCRHLILGGDDNCFRYYRKMLLTLPIVSDVFVFSNDSMRRLVWSFALSLTGHLLLCSVYAYMILRQALLYPVSLQKKMRFYGSIIELDTDYLSNRSSWSQKYARFVKAPVKFYWPIHKEQRRFARLSEKEVLQRRNLYLNMNFLKSFTRDWLAVFSDFNPLRISLTEFVIILKSVYWLGSEHLFFSNVVCHQYIGLDDHSARHFIRHKQLHRQNAESIGVQHSAGNGLFGGPTLALISFDRYLVWNQFIFSLFEKYWPKEKVQLTGYLRLEKSNRSSENRCRPQQGDFRIFLTLPRAPSKDFFEYNFKNFSVLYELIEWVKNEANVSLILKYKPGDKNWLGLPGLEELDINRPKICFVRPKTYSNEDLIEEVDLVVASNGSGMIQEALIMNKTVISIDYFGCLLDLWKDFGSDFMHGDSEGLLRCLQCLKNNERIDVDDERLFVLMGIGGG